jgi:uncharacterized protein with von Willebrand factor type A (vWA) domain
MNLFGIEIKLAKNNKPKYVKQKECHLAMEMLNQRISDLKKSLCARFDDTNRRIEDIKDFILHNR